MASWRPQTDFEDEIVSMQPDHVFIYGELTDQQRRLPNGPRPSSHLSVLDSKTTTKNTSNTQHKKNDQPAAASSSSSPHSALNAIRAVHKIVGTKQMGECATVDDWNTRENAERETIAMIRHFGMGPSLDCPLDKRRTIPTHPISKNFHIVEKGRKTIPFIMDEEFFNVESTRMKNAKLLKELNLIPDEKEKDINLDDIEVLNEDFVETKPEAEVRDEEHKKYLQEFPTLGEQKIKMNKNLNKGDNETIPSMKSFTFNRNKILSTHQSPNTSVSSDSFCSFDDNNSSIYLSANSSVSTNSSSIDGKIKDFKQPAQYYTPKEVYDMKREKSKKNQE